MNNRKITIFLALLITILFNNPCEVEAKTAEELYISQDKFTAFTDFQGTYHEIIFVSKYVWNDKYYEYGMMIRRNGVITTIYSIPAQTMNNSYFYVKNLTGTYGGHTYANVYHMTYGFFNGPNTWYEMGYAFMSLTSDQEVEIIKPPGGENEHLKYGIKITEPPYDNWNTMESRIKIKYSFGLPKTVQNISVLITGGNEVVGSNKLISTNQDDEYIYYHYEVYRDLPDSHNVINIRVNYDNKYVEASRSINRIFGVVDEDGDGIDDRTGLPIGGTESYLTPEGAPVLPENATIFDYVKYAVDSIIYVFAQTALAIKGLIGGIGDIGKILTGFFSFMPQPFTGIIVIGLLIAIILRIFGR